LKNELLSLNRKWGIESPPRVFSFTMDLSFHSQAINYTGQSLHNLMSAIYLTNELTDNQLSLFDVKWDTLTIHSTWSSTLPSKWDLGIPILRDILLIISQPFLFPLDFDNLSVSCSFFAKTIICILFLGSICAWDKMVVIFKSDFMCCQGLWMLCNVTNPTWSLNLDFRKNGQSERLVKADMYSDETWKSNKPSTTDKLL